MRVKTTMRWPTLLSLIGARGWACSCAGTPSAKEAWLIAPVVFVRVVAPFKGTEKDQFLELSNPVSMCSWQFQEGMTLLFYLHPIGGQSKWTMPGCGRTREMREAADDLNFLRGLPGSAKRNRVSGTVTFWDEEPGGGGREQTGLAGVRVRAAGGRDSHETTADAEGVYEFRSLPPGLYSIQLDYPKGTALHFAALAGRKGASRREFVRKDETAQLEVTADSGNGTDFYLSQNTRSSAPSRTRR